jgi:hypothetical protein
MCRGRFVCLLLQGGGRAFYNTCIYGLPNPDFYCIVCVFITTVPILKLFALLWGQGDSGGHVLRETTSRGLCGLVCPSRTSERGGEGDCVKEGGGGEWERESIV